MKLHPKTHIALVWTGTVIKPDERDEVCAWLKNALKCKHNVRYIDTLITTKGRTDVVFEINLEDLQTVVLRRIKVEDLMWYQDVLDSGIIYVNKA